MSSRQRIGVLAAAVVALAVAFFALSPGSEDDDGAPTTTAPTPLATTTVDGTGGTAPATTDPPPPPAPTFTTVRVRDGQPIGGVRTIRRRRGDRVRIRVTSIDTADEIHLHGYDLYRDVRPGSAARFSFEATAEGIFEIELHGSGALIAKLEVRPR